jgi:hypothetical protein
MKFYIITDRESRDFAHVVGEEARRPLLELIRSLIGQMQAAAEDLAKLRKERSATSLDDAPPLAPIE